MKAFITIGLLGLPIAVFAADTGCRVKETVERYEVVCEGEPSAKTLTPPSNPSVAPLTRGKHRPARDRLEQERIVRTKTIKEQRQQESGQPSTNRD